MASKCAWIIIDSSAVSIEEIMLKLDSNGEGYWELKSISAQTLWRARGLAKQNGMYLFMRGQKESVANGTESTLVLSTLVLILRKEPPHSYLFWDYVILHDPMIGKSQSMRCFAREWQCFGPDPDLLVEDIDETLFAKCY